MARELVLSNGELFVGLNNYGEVHDFYFPYVGLHNHAAAKELRHHIGIYVDGQISWLDDGSWQIKSRYYNQSMVGRTVAHNAGKQVSLEFEDCVDTSQSALLRNINVINHADNKRQIKLFLNQAFVIDNSLDGDTVQYLPEEQAILHYKGHRAFICAGRSDSGETQSAYSVGLRGIEGHDGTWRDAEDGELSGNSVEHGQVDSTLGFYLDIEKRSSSRVTYWIAAGTSMREACKIHNRIVKNGLLHYQAQTAKDWHKWLEPAVEASLKLDKQYRLPFISSLMVVKAHQDKRGAIIASGDTTMLNYARDAYAYSWPRDGAYAVWPFLRLGYKEEVMRYFSFCRRVLDSEKGYLMHKYLTDGSLGSSWHSYVHGQSSMPPIQEDETAITVFMFGRFIEKYDDNKLLSEYYPTMIKPMADFMTGYVDADGLPLPSYNLWEEIYQVNTYTVAVTKAGLEEAANLADRLNKDEDAIRWRAAAETIAGHKDRFWNEERQFFYRGFNVENEQLVADPVIDSSSFYGVFMFGLFDEEDTRINTAYQTLKQTIGYEGVAMRRYENDSYNRQDQSDLGNIWILNSLWLAQYAIEKNDIDYAHEIINWSLKQASPSGMLAEQYIPGSLEPTSVCPLNWSHAELLSSLLDIIAAK